MLLNLAGNSSLETFTVNADNTITPTSGQVGDGQVAACWITPAEGFDFVSNTASNDLSHEAELSVLSGKARNLIATLPEEQRRLLDMAFFQGLTHSEIAEKTGEPLGTVKTRIRAGIMTIRKGFNV